MSTKYKPFPHLFDYNNATNKSETMETSLTNMISSYQNFSHFQNSAASDTTGHHFVADLFSKPDFLEANLLDPFWEPIRDPFQDPVRDPFRVPTSAWFHKKIIGKSQEIIGKS